MPENLSQANLRLAANSTGAISRSGPPFSDGNGKASDMTAWADMLSMIGRKNSRLYDFVVRTPRPRSSGNAILRELERERSRIARELHAGAGQPLAGIKLNLEMLDDCFEALPERGRQALTRVQKLVEQALEQVRAVSHSLHPPVWQDLTTAEAIRTLIDATGLGSRMAVELDIDPFPIEPPHAVKVALYRCAQECISNIMRHSGATSFRLGLKANGSMLELRIEDNGHGFHGDARSRGIGLQVLREHADTLDGVCRIASGPTGTTITVALPLTED